jgi:hypothetical protein
MAYSITRIQKVKKIKIPVYAFLLIPLLAGLPVAEPLREHSGASLPASKPNHSMLLKKEANPECRHLFSFTPLTL